MKIKTSLFNSTTKDLTIVIDLLRASTTIIVALEKFNKVIPVNEDKKAFKIKEEHPDAILAGEKDLNTIEGYDITNSPEIISEYEGDIFVINTTNGTKVLENIKNRDKNITVLIGSGINAEKVAEKALTLANEEIELIMAGRHETFNIEDAIGAGLIVDEIIKKAEEENIPIDLDESAWAVQLLAEDKEKAREIIGKSWGSTKLSRIGLSGDVRICQEQNTKDIVGIYENGIITRI